MGSKHASKSGNTAAHWRALWLLAGAVCAAVIANALFVGLLLVDADTTSVASGTTVVSILLAIVTVVAVALCARRLAADDASEGDATKREWPRAPHAPRTLLC